MPSAEGDLYDELVNNSFALCRRMRTVSYWLAWLAVLLAVVAVVVFVLIVVPEKWDVGGSTFFGTGQPTEPSGPPLRWRLQAAFGSATSNLGWAGLVATLAAGLRLAARRLELDLVAEYSDDDD